MKVFSLTVRATLLLLVVSGAAMALTVRPVSPEQVLANSDMIVAGTVVKSDARWIDANQSMIGTDYTITLDRIIHDPDNLFGKKRAGESIVLTFAGGTIGEKWVAIPGLPKYEIGEQAIFFVDKKELHSISPLTGVTAGDCRVSRAGASAGKVIGPSGAVIEKTFFSSSRGVVGGFTLDEFVDEVARALPIAKADPQLLLTNEVEIPLALRDKVFTGNQIPAAMPVTGQSQEPTGAPNALPATEGFPKTAPAPLDHLEVPTGNTDLHDLSGLRYSFLWGPPDPTSNYNIPQVYYDGGSQWGVNFEYSLGDWNRYADLFRVYIAHDNTFGHQGRNDFAFTTPADFQLAYGFGLGGTTLGIAVMFNWWGFNIGTGQKIYESDVILNVNFAWTLDWATAYNGGGSIWFFRSTALHEIGHTFGREHQFTADPWAGYHSVMNYPPSGSLDTEFWLPFVDDAGSIRGAYSDRINALNDLGVHLYRTAGDGSTTPIPVVWSTFPASVDVGTSFTIDNFIVENLGTNALTPQIDWWLTPSQFSYAGAQYLGTSYFGSLGTFAYFNASRSIYVSPSMPTGTYYLAAALPADDFDWNQSTWSNSTITIICPALATPGDPVIVPSPACVDQQYCVYWNPVAGATSYEVLQWGGDWMNVGNVFSACFTTSFCGTYYYAVRARSGCSVSYQSSYTPVEVLCPLGTPSQPTASPNPVCENQEYYISWNSVFGATSYEIQENGGSWTNLGGYLSASFLHSCGSYSYNVRAVNSCGPSSVSPSVTVSVLCNLPAVGQPTATPSAVCVGEEYCITWKSIRGATSYEIQEDGGTWVNLGFALRRCFTKSTCADYSYAIRGVNDCSIGAASPVVAVTVKCVPTPPDRVWSDVNPVCQGGAYCLIWLGVPSASTYEVQENGGIWVDVGNVDRICYKKEVCGDYTYQVRARNECGVSFPTQGYTVTVVCPPVDAAIKGETDWFCERPAKLGATSSGGTPTSWAWSSSCGGKFEPPDGAKTSWTPPAGYSGLCEVMVVVSNDCGSSKVAVERMVKCQFTCGDADGEGTINIADAVYLIDYIFSGGPVPSPLAAGDANCDGVINIADAVYLIEYIFTGGAAPCAGCK